MSALLFSCHNDDETLFAFYQCLRFKPYVIIVLRSYRQWVEQNGPDYEVREAETACVMDMLGLDWEQWRFPDNDQDWGAVEAEMRAIVKEREPAILIAPAWELGGHEDHNAVGQIALGIQGPHTLVRYLTYVRGQGRSTSNKSAMPTLAEAALKEQALACYASQAAHPPTAPWFKQHESMGEWLA